MFSFFSRVFSFFVFVSVSFVVGSYANAEVTTFFNNTADAAVGSVPAIVLFKLPNACPQGEAASNDFYFTTSTINMEITETHFYMQNLASSGTAPAAQLVILRITNQTTGEFWESGITTSNSASEVTFPWSGFVGYPYAVAGDVLKFSFLSPFNLPAPAGGPGDWVQVSMSTVNDDKSEEVVQFVENRTWGGCTDFQLPTGTYGVPKMKLVGSTLTQDIPLASDFGLTGTSSAVTQDFGFFGNMLMAILKFLFVPNELVKTNFEAQRASLITTKFPFAYFSLIQSQMDSVTASSSPAVLTLPFDGHELTFLSASSGSAWMGSENWAFVQALLSAALYLSFGYYIFDRIRGLSATV